jgi:Terminase large subunit, T4likevirus-type, N-terminal
MRFSKPQEYILTSSQKINLFLAGVGSGKTHLGGTLSAYFINNFPQAFGFIGANTYNQLTTSTLYRMREVWKYLYGWVEDVDYVVNKKPPKYFNLESHNFDDYNGIISFRSGAIAFKGSLDNAKAHDGKEFSWAILDETKDSREEDVKDTIITRLRRPGIYKDSDSQLTPNKYGELGELNKPFNPLYILTSPAKVRWINEWFDLHDYFPEINSLIYNKEEFFIKEFKDKCVVISSTWHNAENLPDDYISTIELNNTAEGAKKLIYGNPFVKAGGEFYSAFDRLTHVKLFDIDPTLPIHISFDQNVVPYITATLYQIVQVENGKKQIRQFDEFCLENPKNKTDFLCVEVLKKYSYLMSNGLFFYGDPAGRHSDTRSVEHDYKIVERVFRKYLNNASDRVPYKHPGVLKRKDFINNILDGKYDLEIWIHPRCRKSVEDMEFLKEDVNGKKLKERVKNKDNGTTYEPYGHTSDSFDYFVCEAFKALFNRHFG